MRHIIPFTGLLVLNGVFSLACDTSPVEPAETQGVSTVAEPRSPAAFRSARAAVVIRNGGCGLIDGNGDFTFADRDFIVATQSTRLNTMLTCKVKKVPNPAGRALKYTSQDNPFGPGAVCGIARPDFFVVTTEWTESISASGNATLRCRAKR
jgi:hypothetical protein